MQEMLMARIRLQSISSPVFYTFQSTLKVIQDDGRAEMDSIVKLLSRLLSCVLGRKFWMGGHQVNLLLKQKGTEKDAVVWGRVSHTSSVATPPLEVFAWHLAMAQMPSASWLGPGVGWMKRKMSTWMKLTPPLDCSLPPKVHCNGFRSTYQSTITYWDIKL